MIRFFIDMKVTKVCIEEVVMLLLTFPRESSRLLERKITIKNGENFHGNNFAIAGIFDPNDFVERDAFHVSILRLIAVT